MLGTCVGVTPHRSLQGYDTWWGTLNNRLPIELRFQDAHKAVLPDPPGNRV